MGISLALIYVFIFNAPLLARVFLGNQNLETMVQFSVVIDGADVLKLFLLFVIPFLLVSVIPIWRLSVTEPSEVLR